MMPETKRKIAVRQDIGRRKRFCVFGYPQSRARALTLIEIIISLAIMAIIIAVIVPLFVAMRNSWDSKQGAAETLQSGRILIDHLNRNLSKAVKITDVSVSDEPNGFIVFQDNDGNNLRYDINSTSNYVEFGYLGNLSDLAGPVSQLQFSCYDACDLDTALSSPIDTNTIRFVEVETTLTNSAPLGQDKTLTAAAYLRTNWDSSSSDCNSDPNLVGWWKLDETSGLTAEDSSGNNNDGTLDNMDGDEWTDGIIDGGLEFDGTSTANIEVLTTDMSVSAGTVALWAYLSEPQPSRHQYLFGHTTQPSYNNRIQLFMNNGDTELDVGLGNDHYTLTDVMTLETETWYHVALTWDNGDCVVYINGVEEATETYSGLSTLHNFVWIGNDGNPSEGDEAFDGILDDVRVYDRALDADEVSELANPGVTYEGFTEAKASSDTTSITIPTPDTNEGDLLIAAVATDGSETISPPGGEDWTEIDIDDYIGEVTLGAWWKLADASESSSHEFTWSGDEQAYGWMMRFTGHDPTDPINVYSTYGESSSTPTSPAVTTTVDNCLILRLGAFDDDDITVDSPGLSGHTAITMDKSSGSGSNLIINGEFATSIASWSTVAISGATGTMTSAFDGANGNPAGSALISCINGSTGTNAHRFYQVFAVTVGHQYTLTGDWSGNIVGLVTNPTGGSLRNWAEVFVSFETSTTPTNWGGAAIMYKKAYGDGLTNTTTGIWSWEPITSSPNGSNPPAGGIFTATAPYMAVAFNLGGRADSGSTYIRADNISVIDTASTGTGTVSGGAGYVKQSSAGDSGTSTFSLNSSNEAQMLTTAIAPDSSDDSGCDSQIRP